VVVVVDRGDDAVPAVLRVLAPRGGNEHEVDAVRAQSERRAPGRDDGTAVVQHRHARLDQALPRRTGEVERLGRRCRGVGLRLRVRCRHREKAGTPRPEVPVPEPNGVVLEEQGAGPEVLAARGKRAVVGERRRLRKDVAEQGHGAGGSCHGNRAGGGRQAQQVSRLAAGAGQQPEPGVLLVGIDRRLRVGAAGHQQGGAVRQYPDQRIALPRSGEPAGGARYIGAERPQRRGECRSLRGGCGGGEQQPLPVRSQAKAGEPGDRQVGIEVERHASTR